MELQTWEVFDPLQYDQEYLDSFNFEIDADRVLRRKNLIVNEVESIEADYPCTGSYNTCGEEQVQLQWAKFFARRIISSIDAFYE